MLWGKYRVQLINYSFIVWNFVILHILIIQLFKCFRARHLLWAKGYQYSFSCKTDIENNIRYNINEIFPIISIICGGVHPVICINTTCIRKSTCFLGCWLGSAGVIILWAGNWLSCHCVCAPWRSLLTFVRTSRFTFFFRQYSIILNCVRQYPESSRPRFTISGIGEYSSIQHIAYVHVFTEVCTEGSVFMLHR